MVIVYPIAKDPDHAVTLAAKFSLFLLPCVIYLSGFDFLSLFNFSKPPIMDSVDILSVGTPLKNYIKQYDLFVMNRTAIFKEYLYDCFCE